MAQACAREVPNGRTKPPRLSSPFINRGDLLIIEEPRGPEPLVHSHAVHNSILISRWELARVPERSQLDGSHSVVAAAALTPLPERIRSRGRQYGRPRVQVALSQS